MKRMVFTALVSVAIGVGIGRFVLLQPSHDSNAPQRQILYYRDPMNPQITSPTPQKSSDGMAFVPVYDDASEGKTEKKIAYYRDPMHPWYTSSEPGKAPDCGMDLVPVYEGESDVKGIKIDPVTVQNMGVKTEEVGRRNLSKTIRTVGKVNYNEKQVYSVNTKIMGWVEKLQANYTGRIVRRGEPLLKLYSPELVTTQEEYLQSLRYQKQLRQSTMDEARRGANELVQSARRRLEYWDITEHEIRALEQRGTPMKTMTFHSPVDGIVMEKMVFEGQNVMAGMELFKIADISTVWVLADIYQYELPWVKVGQSVDIELSYVSEKHFKGAITYIYPYLAMETRTAKIRIEVPNTPNFDLKPEMFATVKIVAPVIQDAIAVPHQAVIRSGERNIVVIALGGGYFDPRDVQLGVMGDNYLHILDGIHAGEKIVTSSQFLIDSESNLKAAVDRMTGHAGHDMSKPKAQPKGSPEAHKGRSAKPQEPQQNHSGHNRAGDSGR